MNQRPVIFISAVSNELHNTASEAAKILIALIAIAAGGGGLPGQPTCMAAENRNLERKAAPLTQALAEFIRRISDNIASPSGIDDAVRRALLFDELEKKYGIKTSTLAATLTEMARNRAEDEAIPKIERAKAAYAAEHYPEAERLALDAYSEANNPVSPDKHERIEALDIAGWSALKRLDVRAALAHFGIATSVTDKTENPLDWAGIHHALAIALIHHGEPAEATKLLREVIPINNAKLGADHPYTLASRHNQAEALNALGKYGEAEAEHRAVLKIQQRVLGAEHPDTLMSRNNLANAVAAQNKYAEAEAAYRKLLPIEVRVLGAQHLQTLMTQNNLAASLGAQGKYAGAETELRKVLTIETRVFGAEHPVTLGSRNNLANALHMQGKNAEAEAENRKVLAIRERVLGEQHPDVAKSCYNLALCLEDQQKLREALEFARRALAVWNLSPGAEHPSTKQAKALREKLEAALKDQPSAAPK